jgi:hypothetical protein
VARRGHELDAEAADVPDDRGEDVHVRLAAVAAAGADLAELQRAPEEALQLSVERRRQGELAAGPDHEAVARARGEAMVGRVGDRAFRTRALALRAEETLAEVDRDAAGRADRDGVRGARVGAIAAARRALRRVHGREAAEPWRQGGRGTVGIGERAVALLGAGEEGFDHRALTDRVHSRRG